MTLSSARLGRPLRILGALGLLAATLSFMPSTAHADDPAAPDDSWTATKTLDRTFFDSSGAPAKAENTVTVTADKTTNLQTRERVKISWSGAHPTGGRALNPYGLGGQNQEYPVLVMECRGVDDPSLPADQQISPDTCWTSTFAQRTTSADPAHATWLMDAEGNSPVTDPKDATNSLTGIDKSDLDPSLCTLSDSFAYHITPFTAADGTTYDACSADSMPPSASNNSGEPTNETYAFTGADGSGSTEFEVRTTIENEALGCSSTVACSIVVIPMMGIDCASAADTCNGTGLFEPGSLNTEGSSPDDALNPLYWWSPSNWSRRFSIPVTFAPPPNLCTVSAISSPVPFYGSELLSQAALQWAPAYCLNPERFNWQANFMSDDAATQLVLNDTAVASQPSTRTEGDDDLAYAPTALTGWGIAFNIDKPDGSQLTSLKLNARLLAKLLTESYPGSPFIQRLHPGLATNPYSLNRDPEFKKLNPGLNTVAFSEASSVLMALSTSSAVMTQVTSYIAADPDAMAWINGKADPWGMKVNPFYKGITLPVSTWPLLDTWVPTKTGVACLDQNPAAYMPKMAYPVSSLSLIAQAMLLSWPEVNTVCSFDPTSNSWTIGRVSQEGVGRRFHLGLVSLGDAARYGLTLASLQTEPGHYVAPTSTSIDAAVGLMKEPVKDKPFDLSQAAVRKSTSAYPGTMVVYTAAKAKGLDATSLGQVTQFIDVSSSEGQVEGRDTGDLPAGFVPIVDSGATKKLFTAAQTAEAALKAQDGVPATPVDDTDNGTGPDTTTPPDTTFPGTGDGSVPPVTSVPPTTTTPGDDGTTPEASAPLVKTASVTSNVGNGLLPVLLFVGIATGLAAAIGRVFLMLKGAK